MLIFGHPGLTLGAAALLAGAASHKQRDISWFDRLARYLDIRLLLVGSLLPDIIDKPVGQYFFRRTFENGRIFSHTLLFLFLLAAAGYYLYRRHRQAWLLTLAAGTFTHLVFDGLWTSPQTLFWPLLGFTFPRAELTGWAAHIWRELFSDPAVYVPELIGLGVLLWFGLTLAVRRRMGAFLIKGKVS